MAAIHMVLHSINTRGGNEMSHIHDIIGLDKNRKVVTASADLTLGTLALFHRVPRTANVYTTRDHTYRVPIVVPEKPTMTKHHNTVR